ncbi:MAG TPA: hypothetical protein VGR92_10455 [Steroidobacteraceae bacterium]|nr:hypothetical protein [Steroidobacteraceae bacterium]
MIARIWRGRIRAADRNDSEQQVRPLVSGDLTPARNDAVADPRRSRLYASLRRRFPLRIAAPR